MGGILTGVSDVRAADPFNEVNGMVVIEAENYHSKANTTSRNWYTFPTTSSTPKPDPDPAHPSGVGGGKYVENLPDTRVTHSDPLRTGVNYFASGSGAPRMNYQVRINSGGRYYVRARAYSTGTEDNGVHIGVNNTWPGSGTALQWCDGKRSWYWSGARRTPENHCGVANGIYLDLSAGTHTIMIAQREDGFELDRFILTKNRSYFPSGIGPAESPRTSGGGSTSPPEPGPTGAFVQNSTGLVVMEAENYSANVDRGSHGWDAVSRSGAQAMETRPDTGARIASNYTSTSPYLRFNVKFQKTGTHYVWLRGLCTGDDNSAHVGIGGSSVASGANVTLPVSGSWAWSGKNGNGQRISVNVTSTGVRTVEVYMREDGLALDRVLITTSSSYTPSGTGPAQSPR